jgi:DNA-binding LytR/AlgR family response regulator
MKVVIIEDEAPAARRLKKLLEDNVGKIEILASIESIEGAINWIEKNPAPDLFFMDIQLGDGLSFEIFQKIKVPAPVIFTTAYDEYALQAFKVNSIDYLLKPVQEHELKQGLDKFKEFKNTFAQDDKLSHLQRLLSTYQYSKKDYKNRFLVKLGERLVCVETADISFFKSVDKLTFINTKSGNKYLVEYTLEELEEMLDPQVFFRLNRQFISNISSIDSIHNYFNGKLKLYLKQKDQEEVIISREKAPLFKEWLGQ